MTRAEELADFVGRVSYADMSDKAREQLKIRVLDSLGCAIGALGGEPVRHIREQIRDFGGNGSCSIIGGVRAAPDRAAFYNSALVRYLDFNDSYLAKGETCHPSDNLGAVLAAAEYAGRNGRDFLAALATAYQVQCRLSDVAPVRARGFDHTTQGAFALAAGISKALGLDRERTVNAIAICGTAFNALRVTRTGALSHWKGLAYPNTAFCCTHGAFLAMRGVTGPREVFEGNKGFMDTISGRFVIDWSREDLERVTKTIIKKYNAEIHSQAAIEGLLELQREHGFSAGEIDGIEIDIFDVAYNIIGGGEEGDKTRVGSKEEADHSLHYMVAVALLDGQVLPDQYRPERILRDDVQTLLRKVKVRSDEECSRLFPERHACRLRVTLHDGRVFSGQKLDYEGFHTRPADWEAVKKKFELLTGEFLDGRLSTAIIDAVANLEDINVADLALLLSRVKPPVP
ncbi:MAG: MmgE/PrpD family protein [Geobacteraceae bacterium]|nr:MmgE/PrpD family protein [Geobacteraceae bacterium]